MGFSTNEHFRHYVGSIIVIVLCLALVVLIVLNTIPPENRSIVDLVLGAFVTWSISAMKTLTGNAETMAKEMERRIEEAERETEKYKEKLEFLSKELENTKALLVHLQTDVIKELALLTRAKKHAQ